MSQFGQVFFDHTKVDFSIFRAKLSNCFVANEVEDENKKRAILITCLSDDTYKLLIRICLPKAPDTLTYKALMENLEKHFSPVKCYFAERRKFYQVVQGPRENVREFAERLQNLATSCKFGPELAVIIRDVFVIGLTSERVWERLQEEDALSLDTTFEKVVNLAASKEALFQVDSDVEELCVLTDKVKKSKTKQKPMSTRRIHSRSDVETLTRSWWVDFLTKVLVFLLVFFLLNQILGANSLASVLALAATFIAFYV